jgi:endonuclease/exonuclease/phosphatase family metal-dependent hydrolase
MNTGKTLKAVCLILVWITISCEPIVTTFDDLEGAVLYKAQNVIASPSPDSTGIKVMTWNIRFGIGRLPFFGDSCGDRSIFSEEEVLAVLELIAAKIDAVDPDIILLQEVDRESKRTQYIDQVQWLLDHTDMNYAAYASMWQAQVIPSDGIGRIDAGNVVMSKWDFNSAERIKLPLRTDQNAITQLFYLRRNILKTKVDIPGLTDFYAVNTHTTAFATDDTKQKHIEEFEETLDEIMISENSFVAGGDLNSLSPWASIRDYCNEDKCPGDVCDGDYENNKMYQGSYFLHLDNEEVLLNPLYQKYHAAIDSTELMLNESQHFTHSTSGETFWDRKLDYLFTNMQVEDQTGITHQDVMQLSDHAPVSMTVILE